MASNLLGTAKSTLPNELALLVLDHLENHKSALRALARTCRGMQHLAEERLYKRIELFSVKHLHAIIEAFTQRQERVRAVQTLKILYQYRDHSLKDSDTLRTTFNECVARMVNLREWHIESPYDNFQWEGAGAEAWVHGDMQRFCRALDAACVDGPIEAENIMAERRLGKHVERTVGLGLLESLTIHSHGADTDFWNLDGFQCLFRHPALKHLHVSCVVFPASDIPQLASHTRQTPLASLVFDECVLHPKSLLSILRTPARLKMLTLGENVFNVKRSRQVKPILTKDPCASLAALSAVAHSLESLTHLDPGWRINRSPHVLRSTRPPGHGMRDFHLLKYMECDTDSFLHQAIVMNRDLAPPSLETLRVRRHWDVPVNFWDQPPDFDHYAALPSLKTLDLLQSSHLWLDLANAAYVCDDEHLRNRHAKAYKLFKAGINLKMSIEIHKSPNLIPPYLHAEPIPVIGCLYDASVVGFHRHIIHEETEEGARTALDSTGEAPETDQLGDADISRVRGETRIALHVLKHKFVRPGRRLADLLDSDDESMEYFDSDDDFEIDDLDEEDDMELDLELDDDGHFVDEDGNHIFEEDGELYVAVWETASETETEDDDEDDDEMHDAVESQQQSANDDVD